MRRATTILVAVTLAAAGARWIINSNPWSGPVVWSFSTSHGVHLNDWASFVAWAAAAWLVRDQLVALPGLAVATVRRAGLARPQR